MIKTILAIAAGGAFGALSRHFVNSGVMSLLKTPFPYGTLTVNVLGSFVMGVLIALFAAKLDLSQHWKLFLTVGFLGAFTTFSAFSLDTMTLITRGDTAGAFIYILSSVTLSIGGIFLGSALVWKVFA
jgi:CrcB protein